MAGLFHWKEGERPWSFIGGSEILRNSNADGEKALTDPLLLIDQENLGTSANVLLFKDGANQLDMST